MTDYKKVVHLGSRPCAVATRTDSEQEEVDRLTSRGPYDLHYDPNRLDDTDLDVLARVLATVIAVTFAGLVVLFGEFIFSPLTDKRDVTIPGSSL